MNWMTSAKKRVTKWNTTNSSKVLTNHNLEKKRSEPRNKTITPTKISRIGISSDVFLLQPPVLKEISQPVTLLKEPELPEIVNQSNRLPTNNGYRCNAYDIQKYQVAINPGEEGGEDALESLEFTPEKSPYSGNNSPSPAMVASITQSNLTKPITLYEQSIIPNHLEVKKCQHEGGGYSYHNPCTVSAKYDSVYQQGVEKKLLMSPCNKTPNPQPNVTSPSPQVNPSSPTAQHDLWFREDDEEEDEEEEGGGGEEGGEDDGLVVPPVSSSPSLSPPTSRVVSTQVNGAPAPVCSSSVSRSTSITNTIFTPTLRQTHDEGTGGETEHGIPREWGLFQ